MAIDPALLEIHEYTGPGYLPLVDYGAWRVAVLRYIDELKVQAIDKMQRHDETDEIFVLLAGRFILFLGEGQDSISSIHAEDLQPLKIYNVKKGAWHTHTLSRDAVVLIVENRDTDNHNSPMLELSAGQIAKMCEQTIALWGALEL